VSRAVMQVVLPSPDQNTVKCCIKLNSSIKNVRPGTIDTDGLRTTLNSSTSSGATSAFNENGWSQVPSLQDVDMFVSNHHCCFLGRGREEASTSASIQKMWQLLQCCTHRGVSHHSVHTTGSTLEQFKFPECMQWRTPCLATRLPKSPPSTCSYLYKLLTTERPDWGPPRLDSVVLRLAGQCTLGGYTIVH
jgi:hypothetical protein